eukprot:1250880-Pyramimonas_sp.AAC.1
MAAFACAHRVHFGTHPQTLCGHTGKSTEWPSGCFRMRPPHKCWRTPHTLRGPIGSSSECGAYNDG